MTQYIQYATTIANNFNVTPDYVFEVYRNVATTEASVWYQMTIAWVTITLIGACLLGIAFYLDSIHSHDRIWALTLGFIIGFAVIGLLSGMILIPLGNWMIQMAQPEYTTWIQYASSIKYT